MATAFPPVIARRVVAHRASGRPLTIEFGRPTRARSGEYRCDYRLSGVGRVRRGYACGEDSLQALLLACESVRQALEPAAKDFEWTAPGELGLYRIVPELFGPAASQRVNRQIDRLLTAEARRAIASAKRGGRRPRQPSN